MKTGYSLKTMLAGLLAVFIFNLLTGCESYYYTRPLPADAPEEKSFPKICQGNWLDEDSMPLEISKTFIRVIVRDHEFVVKGAYTPKDYESSSKYSPYYTVHYDAAGRPTDTTFHYLEHSGLIFSIDDGGTLGKGYTYSIAGDTFRINKTDTIRYDLGINARLRRVEEGLYIMNVIQGDEAGGWWHLHPFRINSRDSMTLYRESDNIRTIPEMIHRSGTQERPGAFYYDPYWTSSDILRMFKEGYFEVSSGMKRQ